MLLSAEAYHEHTCIHEAGHAVAAFAVGATIEFAVVQPVDRPRGVSGIVRADADGLHAQVTIFVAGELATDPAVPLPRIVRLINDMAKARALAADYFYGGLPREASPVARLVDAHVTSYLKRTCGRVRRWLALNEQQRAIASIAEALKRASGMDERVEGSEIVRICRQSGVERRPGCLQLDRQLNRRRILAAVESHPAGAKPGTKTL